MDITDALQIDNRTISVSNHTPIKRSFWLHPSVNPFPIEKLTILKLVDAKREIVTFIKVFSNYNLFAFG
jgi:hypothetical protein